MCMSGRAYWPKGLSILLTMIAFAFFVFPSTQPVALGEPSVPILIRQRGLSWTIAPILGRQSPLEFYEYVDFQSKNPLVQANTSLIFLYREVGDVSEGLNLFIIHGPSSRPGSFEGTASLSFSGLPAQAFLLLEDDPDDVYWLSPPWGNISWRWSAGFTDGVVIGGLAGEFTLTIYPHFDSESLRWLLVTGEVQNPQYIELPSIHDPLILQVRLPDPQARFTYRPAEPLVGEPISFDASASRSSAGPILRYRWDFDDDSLFEASYSSPLATYAFQTPGDHRVTLQVEDVQGRMAQEARTIHVRDAPVRVTRRLNTFLPDFQALRGYSFLVELQIEMSVTVSGLGLAEMPPVGWRLIPLDNGGAQFNVKTSEWLFLEPLPAGAQRRIRYQIEVPAQEQPGVYRFLGRALSGLPQTTLTIGGDSEVRVISALSIELAISRLNDQGKIDLTLSSNLISFNQILQAVALWQEQQPVPGTNGRRIDLNTMVRLVAYWLTETPVNQPLPSGS